MPIGYGENPSRIEQILLVEYGKAQDSAEHHDTLLWAAISLIVTGMGALVGFSLRASPAAGRPADKLFFAICGLVLSVLLCFFVWTFAALRNQKYKRCKEIEFRLGMEQHSRTTGHHQVVVVWFLSGVFFGFFLVQLCRILR